MFLLVIVYYVQDSNTRFDYLTSWYTVYNSDCRHINTFSTFYVSRLSLQMLCWLFVCSCDIG